MRAFVPAARRMSDTGITTAFADLLKDDRASEWSHSDTPYYDGYVLFANRSTKQEVWYHVHSQALEIYPKMTHEGRLEFHTLLPDQWDQRPSRVVCVHHQVSWSWARVAVFSSHAMEWQIFPESGTPLPVGEKFWNCMVVNGFVCWLFQKRLLALNTASFQFSRVDLPPCSNGPGLENSRFNIGSAKDGDLCLVGIHECKLSVWFWTPDSDGLERFMLYKTIRLHRRVREVTKCSAEDMVDLGCQHLKVIDGFVYLCLFDGNYPQSWFLSICLETEEVNLLFQRTRPPYTFVSYIMAWPPSLIHKKEDSETQVSGGKSVGDHGPLGTQASPVLFTALRSFKEALIDDGNEKFVEIEAFLLDDEINSLQNKIATLDAGLAAARDRVLRIGVHSDIYKQRTSLWRICKGILRRARYHSHCFAS